MSKKQSESTDPIEIVNAAGAEGSEAAKAEVQALTPNETGSPSLPDHLRPGLGRSKGAWPGFCPVENNPELLARIQDPSGSLARTDPSGQVYVDGYDAYHNPCRIPV